MNSELGEVLLESRPSLTRRLALSVILIPIGLSLTVWSFLFAGFSIGVLKNSDWDRIPIWFLPIPLAMGSLCLFADWWYLSRVFRCHENGVSMRSICRTKELAFRAMTGVRMRVHESRWLGIILVLRTFEVWFDPQDINTMQIAFTYNGISVPIELARRISSIVESAGITPIWSS